MAKKATEVKEPELFSDSLIQTLHDHPEVKTVYLNESGEWLFLPRPGFQPFEVSEILAYEATSTKTITF